MSVIKILPDHLVNQIAAGEVVERPASVVKELVENALDAKATKIIIEIENGGATLIKITDNGRGIAKDQLKMAICRHATSKISNENDLWQVETMGFRGEALASIASVSHFSLASKTADQDFGYKIYQDGKEISEVEKNAMNNGTVVEVKNLFFNVPARQKYLKTEKTELGRISEVIYQVGLANPDIHFVLIHNGKTNLDLNKSNDLKGRIAQLFGLNTAEAMLPVFYGSKAFQIEGFIGKPEISRSSGQHQYFFVNNRPFNSGLFAHRIKAAYHSMLMEHKKPVFIINIKIDPSKIDVNVHPRKLEVRFENQSDMIKVLYSAVKTALESSQLIPSGSNLKRYMSDGPIIQQSSFDLSEKLPSYNETRRSAPNVISKPTIKLEKKFSFTAIAQIDRKYILAQSEDGIVIIDQHAAHERVRFEYLMDQFHAQKKETQPLLIPLKLDLSNKEALIIEENLELFQKLGYDIENFGGRSFVINAAPACFGDQDLQAVIKGVIDDLILGNKPTNMQGKIEEMLTYMSCRSAIKFGQSLTISEMQGLLDQLSEQEKPYTCPHGRPTMVALEITDLAKMFGRT